MDIKNSNTGTDGEFYLERDGERAGMLHYLFLGQEKIVIDHTEVDKAYEGRGLGKQLVKAAVEFARENKLRIIPQCPFAKKVFEITPGFADVLFQ